MKKNASPALALLLLYSSFAPLARAQQAPPQQRPPIVVPQTQQQQRQTAPPDAGQDDEDDVVRITTNLVQMDVVVVDKKGNQVTDLRAEDFEVYEDKRQQKITNFSYVTNESAPRPAAPDAVAAATSRPTTAGRNAPPPPPPPHRLRPEQVRRTMALVVDDLGLSFGSTDAVRNALRKFVNEQMQPNDLVAIIRTSAGVGALQQFTSDKRQLHAAIDRVKWNLAGRVSAFAPVTQSGTPQNRMTMGGEEGSRRTPTGGGAVLDNSDFNMRSGEGDAAGEIEQFREDLFAVGTLGAVNFVVRGMGELPGRKSVTLFSDGFSLRTSDRSPSNARVFEALRQLTELANRASVVVYTIDARGLVAPGFTAEDDTAGLSLEDLDRTQRDRAFEIFDTQGGLDYLSQQTGGFLIKNTNDLSRGVRRIIEDQRGYYLIGYRPEGATFNRRYHTFEVKVKRPGLRVRSRKGFYGIRDEETRPVARRTREQQLLAALVSPFSSPDVRLRLTAVFGNDERSGSFMTSLMHINGSDLKFNKQADGTYKAVLDVAGVTYTDNGRVVDSRDQTGTLTMREEAYQKALRDGLVYSFVVPVKKAGAYQLRMAVRDTATERTGSASQFIEVPDLKKNRLALSGLVVSGLKSNDNNYAAASTREPASDGSAASLASPAVRRFRLNSTLDFAYAIYNARLDRAGGRPQLVAQTRIFREGEPVFEGEAAPLNLASPLPDPKRIELGGSIKLGSNLPPGEYVLQIVVTDLLASGKHQTATQWVDFEIVK
ncbi:MAG TPA: VWA domain-containing protein [Pyrinomonadaceae bacterium]|nr:VWA domain-containing protein [Pyrinomonadaceae bacterium]